jgi:hypothetical protein
MERLCVGAGEAEMSRRKGLVCGRVEDGREMWAGAEDLRWADGVVALRGLKLWPMSRSRVFVLLFQRGRLFSGDGADGRDDLRAAGVGVYDPRGFDGVGDAAPLR